MVIRVNSTPFYDPNVRRQQPAAQVQVRKARTKQPAEAEYSDLPYSDFRRMGGACWSKRKLRPSTQIDNQSEMVQDRRKAYFIQREDWDKTNPDFERMNLVYAYTKRDSLPDMHSLDYADLDGGLIRVRLKRNGSVVADDDGNQAILVFKPKEIA